MFKRDAMLQHLRVHRPVIAPSMLKCDFANLLREVQLLDKAGLPLVHWDVMDGHFVPNLSYGAMVIRSLRRITNTPFDAHLMISDPAKYLDDFLDAGCEAITFHLECEQGKSEAAARELLTTIRDRDVVAGLAINPDTPIEAAEPLLEDCDLLLVMSVQPGFGGQTFLPDVLSKVRVAREVAGERLLISVDGGIGPDTIAACADAGADVFVAGSSIFEKSDYGVAGRHLAAMAQQAASPAEGSA